MIDPEAWPTIDENLRKHFESQWVRQAVEGIGEFLPAQDVNYYWAALSELIHLDMELAWRIHDREEPRLLEEYFAAFPGIPDVDRRRLAVWEFQLRQTQADAPSPAEYQRRFRALFPSPSDWDEMMRVLEDTLDGDTDTLVAPFEPSVTTPMQEDFGDYEIQSVIARGGMGVVYRARQKSLKRTVALKMILSGQHASPEDIKRFRREAEAAASLDHPGIVPIFDVGEHEGRHYFSMGYVQGDSLATRLRSGPLDPKEAARITIAVAEALQCAHEHSVVHRDLKPANVLLDGTDRPRVTDFGLAKSIETDGDLTVSGQILGTPPFMPPEQAAGRLDLVGPLSDVYALGALYYACLVARPPFQAAATIDTLNQVIHEPPVSPRQINPRVPVDAATICLKCLEKSPTDRYQSASEVAQELQRHLNGEPILAKPVGKTGRLIRWCRRRPVTAGLIATACVALIALASAALLAQQASRARAIGGLTSSLERGLASPRLDSTYLDEMESHVRSLARLDVDTAAEFRFRLSQQYASAIGMALERPGITQFDKEQISQAIDRLARRDSLEAAKLRRHLGERVLEWTEVLRYSEQLSAQDLPSGISIVDGHMQRTGPGPAWLDLGGVTSTFAELTVEFAPGWRGQSELGVGFIEPLPTAQRSSSRKPSETRAESESNGYLLIGRPAKNSRQRPETLGQSLDKLGEFRMELWEAGRLLQVFHVPADLVQEDSLRWNVRRQRQHWKLQVNHHAAWDFYDIFPAVGKSYRFGVLWASGCGITSLRASNGVEPSVATMIERGDAAFLDGDFATALESYQQQSQLSNDRNVFHELRLKQAVCLLRLNRTEAGMEHLRQIMEERAQPWSQHALCHLWTTLVQQGKTEEAGTLFSRIESDLEFQSLATQVPVDTRNRILRFYTKPWQAVDFRPSQLHVDRLRLASDVQQRLGATLDEQLNTKWVLLHFLLYFEMLDEAESQLRPWIEAPYCTENERFTLVGWLANVQLLRGGGDAVEKALRVIDRWLPQDQPPPQIRRLLHAHRARVLAHAGRYEEAFKSVQELLRLPDEIMSHPMPWLVTGFVVSELYDNPMQAQAIWHRGFKATGDSVATPWHVMLAGLARTTTPAELKEMTNRILQPLAQDASGKLLSKFLEETLPTSLVNKVVYHTWNTSRGRQVARDLVFFHQSELQVTPLSARLIAYGWAKHLLMGSGVEIGIDAEHDAGVWQFTEDLYQAYLRGDVSQGDAIYLYAAYRGNNNFVGWQAIQRRWPPVVRGALAYAMGNHFFRLGQLDDAAELFETAGVEVPRSHPLYLAMNRSHFNRHNVLADAAAGHSWINGAPIRWQYTWSNKEVTDQTAKSDPSPDWPSELWPPLIKRHPVQLLLAKSKLRIPQDRGVHLELQSKHPLRVLIDGEPYFDWAPSREPTCRTSPSYDNGGLWTDAPPGRSDRVVIQIPKDRVSEEFELLLEIPMPLVGQSERFLGWYKSGNSYPLHLENLLLDPQRRIRQHGLDLFCSADERTATAVLAKVEPLLQRTAPERLARVRALRLWRQGDPEQAQLLLRETLKRSESPTLLRDLAMVLRETQQWRESANVLEHLNHLRPKNAMTQSARSDSWRRSDVLGGAIEGAKSAVLYDPQSPHAHVARAYAFAMRGNPGIALREFERAKELGASGPEIDVNVELSRANRGQRAALTRAKAILNRHPELTYARFQLAIHLINTANEPNAAVQLLESLSSKTNDSWGIPRYLQYAQRSNLSKQQQLDALRQLLEQAGNEDTVSLRIQLMRTLNALGRFEEAWQAMEPVLNSIQTVSSFESDLVTTVNASPARAKERLEALPVNIAMEIGFCHAVDLVLNEQTDNYLAICEMMREKSEMAPDNRRFAYLALRAMLLARQSNLQPSRLVELAEAIAKDGKPTPWYKHVLAMALLRDGKAGSAEKLAREIVDDFPNWAPDLSSGLIALTLAKQGRTEEASQLRDKLQDGSRHPTHFHDQISASLVRSELDLSLSP